MKASRKEINEKISHSLKGTGHPSIKKICERCHTEFDVEWRKRKQRFCSRSCKAKSIVFSQDALIKMAMAKSGENNPMFGVSPKNTKRLRVESEKHAGKKIFFVRSTYEKQYVDNLTSNPTVLKFEYEPKRFRCKYRINEKTRTYQPDFLVNEIDKEYVVEIKAKWQIDSEETKIKSSAFKAAHNIDYRILT